MYSLIDSCRDSNSWHCYNSRQCIHRSNLCDGRFQCADYSDESACSRYFNCFSNVAFEMYYYQPMLHCIPYVLVCDGVTDCINQSDERNCNLYF